MILTVGNAWGAINPTEPSKDASGVYQIGTAEELWGFANLVNGTSGTNIALNAKLTDDIELPAEDFPMIGVYNTKKYAGTFDGDGHTISGLQISSTATGIGLFRITYGATIKNFKLSGTITVTNGTSSTYFVSSVVGFADNNTKIEDVSSSVNITFNGGAGGTGGVRIVGGIAGRVKGTLNRCRYNGTIDASNASAIGDRLAGICAEGNSTLNITNCLFDGTLKTACTATGNNHRVGGVVAFSNGATVKVDNCLSVGSYEFAATASLTNCGVVSGVSNAATCTNTYYTTTTNLSNIGITSGGVTAVGTTPWSTITDNLNGGAAVTTCNWKIVSGQDYPIPMAWTKTNYTIIFKDWDGTTLDTKYVEQGGTLTLPDEPSREGYTFSGWSPEVVMQPTKDATYTAQYTINQYDVKYYVDGVLTYTDSYDYGADVTAHDAPSKDRYTFSGWSTVPSTMPANDVRVDGTFTYTANASGVYEIGNREDFVNFVAVTKTNAAACGKLISNIDLNNEAVGCIGSSSASYTGTFDGQGYTISNYYRNTTSGSYSGLFAHVTNATIRNFNINGEVTIGGTGQQHGSVIGTSVGSTLVEDVHSSVNVTISSTAAQVGGFVGRAGGTYNRCRYNGTVSTATAYDKIGGFASNLRDGHLNNCLFDGTLSLSVNNANLKAGGLVGAVIEAASTIEGCLSHGTITIDAPTANCGIAIGFADKNITVSKLYYTTTNAGTLPGIGTVTATLTGSAKDVTSWTWADVNEGLNPSAGSVGHWHIVAEQAYPVPGQCEHTHVHTWGDDGYCKFDGARQPIEEVDGYYLIANKGQFWAFYEIAQTNSSKNAKLTADIDLDEEPFNGFTGYTGTFDGQKHTISGYKRTFTSGNSSLGFFNTTSGATIKDFTLQGEEIYDINSACYAIGSVIGMSTNTTIEGVTSKVNMTFGANCPSGTGGIRVVGGLVGRISGGSINKCRYNGTIDLSANSGISDRFGGIVGDLGSASTISNCLFDGEIKVAATSSLSMGGILGTRNSQTPTIQHCLFNGKMTFPAGANVSNCGPISGGTGVTASDSYYDMTGFTVGGTTQARTAVQQSSSIERTTQPWIDILVLLNAGSSNWGIQTENYPVPGDQAAATYTITFNSNGGSDVAQISLPAGAAITAPENPTWEGHTFTGWNPALPATMPSNDLAVTAQWRLTKYAVNYYVDDILTYTDSVEYSTTITAHTEPTKERYTFSGWRGFPDGNIMPANDVRIDSTFTFTANALGVFEIGNQEDLFNFAAYVNATGLGTGSGHGSANAKLLNDIVLDGTTPFPGIGKYVTYQEDGNNVFDPSYAYTGTFDGQGYKITGYVRNVTGGNYGGMFNYTNNATIKNFSLAGTMSIAGTAQQYGSVIGCSAGTTLVEDVHSSVNVTISSTASQVGGFVGRAGGTYNRCRYDGTVSSETAYDKIGGFAGNITAGTLTNCLFDGTITLSAENEALKTSAFVASSFGNNPHVIKNCLVNGTMNISHPTDNCGIVVGYYEQALTVDHTYYTGSGNAITGAKGTLTGFATPVGTLTWQQLLTALNPTTGTDGNWEIKAGKDYPVPSKCTITEHQHSYINGFCISGDAYQPAEKAQDGYYEIDNAGKLWWIAQQLNATENGLPKNIRIKLTADIDMEGDKHGSFPGICPLGSKQVDGTTVDDWDTAFQGIFNGQGYNINNYYRKLQSGLRQGLFNVVYDGAQIKNFNINGNLIVNVSSNSSGALMGVVVGVARGTSTIEDINSNVNITASGSRGVGGIVGCLENSNNQPLTKLNRCRYNGTITVSSTNMNDGVGGIAGEIRSAIMTNVLFDGQIIVKSGAKYKYIGGITGVVRNSDNSEIHRALSHGTIKLEGGHTTNTIAETTNGSKEVQGSLTGIFIGGIYKTLYMNKCFHTTSNVTEDVPAIGPQIHEDKEKVGGVEKITHTFVNDLLLGSSTDMTDGATIDNKKTYIYSENFHTTLGKSNWEIETYEEGKYPYPKRDPEHIHFYENGFCTAGDGEYEKPSRNGNTYVIDNGGKLYWFAEHFNAGEIAQDVNVELKKTSASSQDTIKVINMEGDKYTFPGIGTESIKFKGKFYGRSFTIKNFKRNIVNSQYTGLVNYAEDAVIRDFQLEGEINYNLTGHKSFHGTVVGYFATSKEAIARGDTALIEDVYSFVNVKINNIHTRVWGGIAGRASGKINRCRYSGVVAKDYAKDANGAFYPTNAMESGQQIGGICGNAQTLLTIENCLFDGTIKCYCPEKEMRVAGILSSNEANSGVKILIKNCLFNGCLDLKHTYTPVDDRITQNGIIAGYWDTGISSLINNVYYLKKCAEEMKDLEPGKYETPPTKNDVEEIVGDPTPEQWKGIYDELDEKDEVKNPQGNGNWTHGDDNSEEYPTPGGHVCDHKNKDGSWAYNEYGYCTICGDGKPLETDEQGRYIMEAISDLAGFRDLINSGTNGSDEFNAKLTQDIDFSDWEDFGEPIGNSHFNRYLYNFDGQGYKMLNVKITTNDQYLGFFGFAGNNDHDCVIHDFTITGVIESLYDSKQNEDQPLYMGVVGKMYRGKIYNVHSELTMRNTSPTRAVIGGIVGCVETGEGTDSDGNNFAVKIDKCSYTGNCEINAVVNFGGIVGQTSRHTEVKNCTFAGNVNHTYKGVNNSTNFSGIVGYNEEETFKGIQNCIVAGVMKTDDNREFVPYGTAGNHKNALVGEDKVITNMLSEDKTIKEESKLTQDEKNYLNQYSGNYAWNAYASLVPANTAKAPVYVAQEKFISGEICAIMNSRDDNSSDIQNGHPWRQILGYQIGDISKGQLNGSHTEGSPAQRVPLPGYVVDKVGNDSVKISYKVVREVNASDNTKYDYIADWYYFDDQGDSTPFPTDAASLKVKKIEYHRAAEHLTGYNSFVLPFEFTQDMKSAVSTDAKIYLYNTVSGNNVQFTEKTEGSIAAGTPFILYANKDEEWAYTKEDAEGITIPMTVTNPSADGLYGSFDTMLTGAGFYKLTPVGDHFVKTIGSDDTEHGPLSHCYPYRAYLKLPKQQNSAPAKEYVPVFEDGVIDIENDVDERNALRYNVMGQRVNENAKGIIIVNGKKYLKIK